MQVSAPHGWLWGSLVLRLLPHFIRRGKVSFPTQPPSPDISGSDRVHLVWEILVEFVIVSDFELRRDHVDGAPVFVLFILVSSLFPRNGTLYTERPKEQVLATVVPDMAIRRSVCILVGPLTHCDPVSTPEQPFGAQNSQSL